MRFYDFYENYLSFISCAILFGTILNNCRLFNTILYFIFFLFISYVGHVALHSIYIPFFTEIHNTHHEKKHKNKYIYIFLESFFIEFLGTGGFLLFFNIPYVTKYLIVYYSFLYITIHFINYHIDNSYHKKHHKNKSVNYGIMSLMDRIFSTCHDKSQVNMNSCSINCIVLFVILFFIKNMIE